MAKIENKIKENPKLEQKTLSDGRISLYLEYYLGRDESPVLDIDGNRVYYQSGAMAGKPKFQVKHKRRKENPVFRTGTPKLFSVYPTYDYFFQFLLLAIHSQYFSFGKP